MNEINWIYHSMNDQISESRGYDYRRVFGLKDKDHPMERAIAIAERCRVTTSVESNGFSFRILRNIDEASDWLYCSQRSQYIKTSHHVTCRPPRRTVYTGRQRRYLVDTWYETLISGMFGDTSEGDHDIRLLLDSTKECIGTYRAAYILAKRYREGKMPKRDMPRAHHATPVKSADNVKVLFFKGTNDDNCTEEYDAGDDVEVKHVKSFSPVGKYIHERSKCRVVAAVPLFERLHSTRGFVCEKITCGEHTRDGFFLPLFLITENTNTYKFVVSLVTGDAYCDIGQATTFKNAVRRIKKVWTKAIFNPEDRLEQVVADIMKAKYLKLTPRIPSNEEAADAIMAAAEVYVKHELRDVPLDRLYTKEFTPADFCLFRLKEVASQTGLDLSEEIKQIRFTDHGLREFLLKQRK
jgi:hypothetical protein